MSDNRLLRINGVEADIDGKTAIGINLQSYDLKSPGKKYINTSNSFTIPKTAGNRNLFGDPANPQSESKQVYAVNYCDYWIGNDQLITNSKIRLQVSGERITCFIYEKVDFWEQMKKDLWPDVLSELLAWLASEKGLPVLATPNTDTPADFLKTYVDATSGVILPFTFGNLYEYTAVGQKHIEYTEVVINAVISPPPTRSINYFIDSDHFSQVTGFFELSTVDTAEGWAIELAQSLNGKTEFTEFYTAVADGSKVYAESNEGLTDATFNLKIVGPYIETKENSILVQSGLTGGSGPLENLNPDSFTVAGSIQLKYTTAEENAIGGHFCIHAKTLFEFFEYKYGVDFLTSGGGLVGNIWDDPIALKMFMPFRDLDVYLDNGDNYFKISQGGFLPLTDQLDKADKSIFDLVTSFMQTFNIIKDEFPFNTLHTVRLARFDDLETTAPIIEFSDRITGTPEFKPFVDGYGQENRIKYKEIYPEGDELINSKTLLCKNENINAVADLLEIDAYIPSIVSGHGVSILNYKDKESFKTFSWALVGTGTSKYVAVNYWYMPDGIIGNAKIYGSVQNMQIAEIYDLNSEYNFLGDAVEYPVLYKVKKWLTISDIRSFVFFAQYYVRELNGSFFVNKIEGFNPKSKQPTTLELLKVSNRTPISPANLNYYVDGVLDPYTDGAGDQYF